MKKLGKKGAIGIGGGIGIAAVVIIAIVAVLFTFGIPQTIMDGGEADAPTSDPAGTACKENPSYIDNFTADDFLRGTGINPTFKYVTKADFDAGTGIAKTLIPGSTGTDFNIGDEIVILNSLANYIDSVEEVKITSCGRNDYTITMKNSASTAAVLDILEDGTKIDDTATGTGITANITGSANNVAYTVRIDGTKDDSTGEMLLTIEGNDTEISDIIISASSGEANVIDADPNTNTELKLFVAEGTAPSLKAAFTIGAIEDGKRAEYLITLVPETGITLGAGTTTGFLYHNLYAAQWFVDDDGTLQYGFEDSDGTLKYENVYADHDALIVA